MARQLLLSPPHNRQSINTFQVGMAGMTLFLCAMALFMCASHSRRLREWRACYEPDTDDPVMHIHHGDIKQIVNDSDEQEVSVWQKNILMGGKCQLPDFSGVIIYDSEGNAVTPANNRRLLLPWK